MKTAVCFSIGLVLVIANILLANVSIEISPVSAGLRIEHPVDAPSVIAAAVGDDVSNFITERQLFSPERRDFVPAAVADIIPEPPPTVEAEEHTTQLNIRLIGTRSIQTNRAALLQYSEADAEWFPLGETIEGWTIQDISSQEVILVSGEESRVIELETDSLNDD